MVSSLHDVPGQNMYFTWQRKRKPSKNCKDIISSLPDDILIHILSLLDLREAATTSVLSKRWRYVWANLSNLDFDGLSTLHGQGYSTRYESEACKYVHRVNQVVGSSLAPRIHKFRIRFLLGASFGYDIRSWVNFAMRKNVRELELNFSSCVGVGPEDPFYIDSFRCYARYPSAHSLVSLSLSGVRISGYFLESVLINFPNLERLTMKYSYCSQSKLNVVGDLLKLRHLEVSYCYDYKELEISAGNLISFVYFGGKQNVKFSYVPLLNEVSVSGSHSLYMIRSLHNSGFLPQVTKLKLRVVEIQDFIRSPVRFPQCGNLEQLDFTFVDGACQSLLIFTNLIDACPVLHKFKLQDSTIKKPEDPSQTNEEEFQAARCLIRKYWETVEIIDSSMSKLRDLCENEKVLSTALVSKGKLAARQANSSSLIDSEIIGLFQLISEKEELRSKESYNDSLKRCILNVLRTEPVIPIECERDVKLAKLLKDEYGWNGTVMLSARLRSVEEGGQGYVKVILMIGWTKKKSD